MGYPNRHSRLFRFYLCTSLVLLLAFSFPVLDGIAAGARGPSALPPGDWDHVIITDQSLKPSFIPLAHHRNNQGLRCRILSTHVIRQWSRQEDLTEAVRWFVSAAHETWGTRYVLLGGDSGFIPVPLGFYASPNFSWEIPLDLYYAAPYGEWDLDEDGILGEAVDDAPDLTPVVALGRTPVSSRSEARTFVDKVIAFETNGGAEKYDVLLAAEVGVPFPWQPGMDIQFDFAWEMERVADVLAGWEAIGDIQQLYQSQSVSPLGESLNPDLFLDALRTGHHRFLGLMLHGIPDTWSLGPAYLEPDRVAELEGMDHSFFLAAGIAGAADCRDEAVLKSLLDLPDGGCVGAVAPGSLYFLAPVNGFFRDFWQVLATGGSDRVGDAYRQALLDQLPLYSPTSAAPLASLQSLSVVGDPALLFRPVVAEDKKPKVVSGAGLTARASPNPFNPATEISFVLSGAAGVKTRAVVDIFDLAGRRMVRLLDTELGPGHHSVPWKGEDAGGRKVGSGLFFARIRAGDAQTVVKLVLVE